jgi:hypothetical protein
VPVRLTFEKFHLAVLRRRAGPEEGMRYAAKSAATARSPENAIGSDFCRASSVDQVAGRYRMTRSGLRMFGAAKTRAQPLWTSHR